MKKILIILSIGLFLITSCSPSKTLVDTSCVGYRNTSFNRANLLVNNIAVMPILGGSGKEEYRNPMGVIITDKLEQIFPVGTVIAPKDVISILNTDNLIDNYHKTITNYRITGIIDKNELQKIGKSLNTKYILFIRLLSDTESALIYSGYYNYTKVSVDEIFVQTQIWNAETGVIEWEGKGGTACLYCDNIMDKTATGLVKILGLNRGMGACEQPSEIINSIQEAQVKSILAISCVLVGLPLLILAVMNDTAQYQL